VDGEFTNYDLEVFPYESISSIEMGERSITGHRVNFLVSGNEARMTCNRNDDVARFVKIVKRRMKGGTPRFPRSLLRRPRVKPSP
jgi:hypothetical protein